MNAQHTGPRHIKAALIDMDGTLYDSMPRHARAWHRMVREELGIETNVDDFFAYEGMTGADTVNLLLKETGRGVATPDEVKRLYDIKSAYFRADGPAPIMPGAKEMVDYLRSQGIKTVLVTGSGQASLLDKVNADFDGAFALRVTAHDVTHGKPQPEPYLKALQLAGCAADEAIVIENAPLGVKAGVAAGIFTVAVITGPIPRQAFVEAGANAIYNSMAEFAKSLPQLLLKM